MTSRAIACERVWSTPIKTLFVKSFTKKAMVKPTTMMKSPKATKSMYSMAAWLLRI